MPLPTTPPIQAYNHRNIGDRVLANRIDQMLSDEVLHQGPNHSRPDTGEELQGEDKEPYLCGAVSLVVDLLLCRRG